MTGRQEQTPGYPRGVHGFALATAAATALLVWMGGLVTSKGAGMAVPDWPTSYGYNMFLLPISYWKGGIFYEHSHRLMASLVGMMTLILMVWLLWKEERRWMKWLGVVAVVTVIGQGVLGGLRVNLFKDELGIFHGTLAQLFLVLVGFMALATSAWWRGGGWKKGGRVRLGGFGWAAGVALALVFLQLVLGATMRHQHAGLAVPDFPLAYGQLWPRMDEAFVASVNAQRVDVSDPKPITAFQIGLHMVHRIGAVAVLGAVLLVFVLARRAAPPGHALRRWSGVWLVLVLVQAGLGAATVWSNKAADVATLHVLVGSLCLASGAGVCVLSRLYGRGGWREERAAAGSDVRGMVSAPSA